MTKNSLTTRCTHYAAAITIAILFAGCEARVSGPPALVIGAPPIPGPPGIEIVDAQGYHHHGYYDDHHAWHGGYEDEHHVHHDDPGDWHR